MDGFDFKKEYARMIREMTDISTRSGEYVCGVIEAKTDFPGKRKCTVTLFVEFPKDGDPVRTAFVSSRWGRPFYCIENYIIRGKPDGILIFDASAGNEDRYIGLGQIDSMGYRIYA